MHGNLVCWRSSGSVGSLEGSTGPVLIGLHHLLRARNTYFAVQESMAGRALEKEIDMRPMGGIGAVKQERVVIKKEE